MWKAQGLIRISYAIYPDPSPNFTIGGRLNAPDAPKVVHCVSFKLQEMLNYCNYNKTHYTLLNCDMTPASRNSGGRRESHY
jgi:hypothetical protein